MNGHQSEAKWGRRGTAGATIAGQLSFAGVGFSVPGKTIVQDISFELAPGEIASILGPSGCGKTTVLRLAAGVSRPTTGRIFLDAKELSGPGALVPPEKRNIGLMFQDFVLFPHLNVIQNVKFGLHAWGAVEAEASAKRALERVGMAAAAEQYPHQLSGGEQQRVALARAIVPRPQVLLMDEPFSGLDQRLRESVRAETLALLREMRATAILVTHDPAEAMEVSDRILLMRSGRIIQDGTPQDLFAAPSDPAASKFFSDCNELLATVRAGAVVTVLGQFPAHGFEEGEAVLVHVRPHTISLARAGEGTEAFVKESHFLGHAFRLHLIFPDTEQAILAEVPGNVAPARGETARFVVRLSRENRGVLVFKKP